MEARAGGSVHPTRSPEASTRRMMQRFDELLCMAAHQVAVFPIHAHCVCSRTADACSDPIRSLVSRMRSSSVQRHFCTARARRCLKPSSGGRCSLHAQLYVKDCHSSSSCFEAPRPAINALAYGIWLRFNSQALARQPVESSLSSVRHDRDRRVAYLRPWSPIAHELQAAAAPASRAKAAVVGAITYRPRRRDP